MHYPLPASLSLLLPNPAVAIWTPYWLSLYSMKWIHSRGRQGRPRSVCVIRVACFRMRCGSVKKLLCWLIKSRLITGVMWLVEDVRLKSVYWHQSHMQEVLTGYLWVHTLTESVIIFCRGRFDVKLLTAAALQHKTALLLKQMHFGCGLYLEKSHFNIEFTEVIFVCVCVCV